MLHPNIRAKNLHFTGPKTSHSDPVYKLWALRPATQKAIDKSIHGYGISQKLFQ